MRRKRVKFKLSDKSKKRRKNMSKKGVSAGDLTELCAFKSPPKAVKQVVYAYALLIKKININDKEDKWSRKVI